MNPNPSILFGLKDDQNAEKNQTLLKLIGPVWFLLAHFPQQFNIIVSTKLFQRTRLPSSHTLPRQWHPAFWTEQTGFHTSAK